MDQKGEDLVEFSPFFKWRFQPQIFHHHSSKTIELSATPKRGLDLQWSGLAMVFFNQKYENICIKLKK